MAESHNHHFVPQGYLRHFGSGVGRKAKVAVFDLLTGKRFESLTRNVASRRDFNRIEAEGHHPNALEEAYSQFEGEAVPALERIVRDRGFKGNDRELVLNLMALLGIRHPARRDNFDEFLQRIYKATMHQMVRDEATWKSISSKATEAGYVKEDGAVPFEKMKAFIKGGEYDIITHQNEFIRLELETFETLLRCLGDRKWHLYIARDGEPDFITSDHPICLGSTIPRSGPYGLGFGLKHTYVAFPLTRRAALWGTFEIENACAEVSIAAIAELNRRVISHSQRQVYAKDDQFFYRVNGDIIGGERLITDKRFSKAPEEAKSGRVRS